MRTLPKSLTTITSFSKYLTLSLFVILPILFFILGVHYSFFTQSGNTSITHTPDISIPIPIENVLYLAKFDGKDALYFTNERAKRGSANTYIGQAYITRSVEHSGFTSDLVFDFRALDYPLPISAKLPHSLIGISSILFNKERDILYVSIQDEKYNKIYRFKLDESTYELLWSNEMGKGENYLGNDGHLYNLQLYYDLYLFLTISECHGGCASPQYTHGILNTETKKVKYFEPIFSDIDVDIDKKTFSYRKRVDTKVLCKDLTDEEISYYGCSDGFVTKYYPSKQTFTEVLP